MKEITALHLAILTYLHKLKVFLYMYHSKDTFVHLHVRPTGGHRMPFDLALSSAVDLATEP